ncbi:MAG: RNA polymerase factor sigma-54 [Spirochaetaceae bacterium]|jgi:RNA polymerase sigma-54 factor|nr:RNA polymerase factor sigma-54 [Spirochaetaceae bacterium]
MQQRQALILEQGLRMNPQLFQSIKIMELPVLDLRAKIAEEMERNPALEVLEEPGTVSLDAAETPGEEDDYFEASSDSGFIQRGMDADARRQFIEGTVTRPETLQEHLLWQLALEPVDDEVRYTGELLIQNLDDDGFHKEDPEILLKNEKKEYKTRLREALAVVRSLDPPGTCTSGYRESLQVQARLLPDAPPGLEAALDYLKNLEKGKFAETAQILDISEETLRLCYSRIQEDLSPFPGRYFNSGETRYTVPDLEVRQKEGEFVIILNNEEIPVLGISPFFMKVADKKGRDGKEARDFVRENIREARWFIQSINQRNHTLLRVARAIVEFQRAFFSKGPKYLVPLTLRDIAQELGVHETTISRTANSKSMQTEWGLYEIRYFFSNSITGTGSKGSRFSKEGVKEILKEIITGDQRRLSDQELADTLTRRGIPLARRTVAKYRSELDLGSSYTR